VEHLPVGLRAGAVVQWLRDGLGLLDNAAQSEALARSVPDSGGTVFVPALTGLGAPYWDPDARGDVRPDPGNDPRPPGPRRVPGRARHRRVVVACGARGHLAAP
jgi:sugar (pentulose or hexulose) kinase